MKFIAGLIFLFSFFTVSGQINKPGQHKKFDINTYLEKIYDSLKRKGTTNLITVKRSFSGLHIMDSLGPAFYYYLFWQHDTNICFQKIKHYYDDRIIRSPLKLIIDSDIFTYLNNYFDSIKNEELLPFISKYESNGIESYNILTSIHQGFYDLTLYSKNETIYKSFEHLYLQKDIGSEISNLNYRYNSSTKLMSLWNRLWEQVKNEFP